MRQTKTTLQEGYSVRKRFPKFQEHDLSREGVQGESITGHEGS